MNVYEQREKALFIIMDYMRYLEDPAEVYWRKAMFEQRSYSQWAIYELYDYVKTHENFTPIEAVAVFIDKMDKYSSTPKTGYRFSVAYDIATDILDALLEVL